MQIHHSLSDGAHWSLSEYIAGCNLQPLQREAQIQFKFEVFLSKIIQIRLKFSLKISENR